MKRVICILTLMTLVFGCGVSKKAVTPETRVQYTYKDSTRIVDSLRYVDLPVERVVDMVAVYDTLELETSAAKARAYVDTNTHTLRGSIENKEKMKAKVEYKEHIIYRDSIYTKEVPVPYEVTVEKVKYPALFWVLLVFAIMVIGAKFPKLLKTLNFLTKFDWKKLMFWKKIGKKNKKAGE